MGTEGPLKVVPRNQIQSAKPFRRAKIISAVGATAILAFHAVPHFFPQINRNAFELKVKSEMPQVINDIYKETCEKMGINSYSDKDLFINNGFLTVSAGSFLLPNKVVIGLPRSFLIKDVETLRKSKVQFDTIEVDWNSKCGRALEKSLLVKNDHVAFAIAHELAHINNFDFVYRALLPAAWLFGTFRAIIWILPRAQNAPTKGFKVFLSVLLAGFSLASYNGLSKILKQKQELRADEQAAKCGVRYCNGGISYLKSHLRVNRVIRHLTGVAGIQRYTEQGDDLQNSTHPLLTERIQRLQDIKIKLYNEKGAK